MRAGQSTYNANYIPHPMDRTTPIRPQYERSTQPFDGTTTYGDYYKQHAMPERAGGHTQPYSPNSAPFDGSTTYKVRDSRSP